MILKFKGQACLYACVCAQLSHSGGVTDLWEGESKWFLNHPVRALEKSLNSNPHFSGYAMVGRQEGLKIFSVNIKSEDKHEKIL